jgi:hypothetical protein
MPRSCSDASGTVPVQRKAAVIEHDLRQPQHRILIPRHTHLAAAYLADKIADVGRCEQPGYVHATAKIVIGNGIYMHALC